MTVWQKLREWCTVEVRHLATTEEQNPTIQEDVAQLESRIEACLQALTREVDMLREEIAQSLEGQRQESQGMDRRQDCSRDITNERLAKVRGRNLVSPKHLK